MEQAAWSKQPAARNPLSLFPAAGYASLDTPPYTCYFSAMLVYLNGHFVAREKALVSVFDHGFLYGDGIYETMRAYDGTLFLLKKHLARLKRSAAAISLKLPLSLEEIADALNESLGVNRLQDAYVRLHISRGPGEIGLDP